MSEIKYHRRILINVTRLFSLFIGLKAGFESWQHNTNVFKKIKLSTNKIGRKINGKRFVQLFQ